MPELPEVETVRRGLAPWLSGRRIKSISKLHPRATRSGSNLKLEHVVGAKITSVERRGKFLWFVLDRDFALVGHLGMSGQMLISPKKSPLERHVRARMDFGDRSRELRFIDQRTFGWLSVDRIVEGRFGRRPESFAHIAPDIFDCEFNEVSVIAIMKKRSIQIKKALLNQEILSGVGNIYADEALWYARIHPERVANTLTDEEFKLLFKSIRKVMVKALEQGGTSFDNLYINVNGESGYFEVSLKAYGREGEPCRRCRTPIRRIMFANRSSHYCPTCQLKSAPKNQIHSGKKYKGSKYARKSRR